MKSTILDTYNAITPRNCLIFAAAVVSSVVAIELFGYLIWRRFVVAFVIIAAATIGRSIAVNINHKGLQSIVNATAVGLYAFAGLLFTAALVDAWLFPAVGYFVFAVNTAMWLWISLHLSRAKWILVRMPVERKQVITDSTERIYQEMTHREERIKEVLADSKKKVAALNLSL